MRKIRIEPPPIHSDLFSLIYGTNQQTDANRQQLDIRQRDAYIAGNYQPLIENAVQNVNQIGIAGYSREAFHPVRR